MAEVLTRTGWMVESGCYGLLPHFLCSTQLKIRSFLTSKNKLCMLSIWLWSTLISNFNLQFCAKASFSLLVILLDSTHQARDCLRCIPTRRCWGWAWAPPTPLRSRGRMWWSSPCHWCWARLRSRILGNNNISLIQNGDVLYIILFREAFEK